MNEAEVTSLAGIDGLSMSPALSWGILIFIGTVFLLSIIQIVSQCILFKKAGVSWWKAIVPLYNSYIMIELAFNKTKNWLIVVPIASFLIGVYYDGSIAATGLIMSVLMLMALATSAYIQYEWIRRYAGVGMTVASLFLPFLILPIIAFSNNYQFTEYNKDEDLMSNI